MPTSSSRGLTLFLIPRSASRNFNTMAARILILMAAASALSVTRRALLLASTSDSARRLLNDLDEASSRLDASLNTKSLPTDLPSKFNVTAGPAQRTGVNQRTGYCWYELAGEWSRLEGDQCSQRDAKGRLQP